MESNLSMIWQQTLTNIKNSNSVSDLAFEEYYETSSLHDLEKDTAYILTEDIISQASLNEDKDIIEKFLNEITNSNYKVEILTHDDLEQIQDNPLENNEVRFDRKDNLNKEYTFANYIVGDYNKNARKAGISVVNKPGASFFNPLFIHGNPGMGKTHLVNAIGNEIKNNKPTMRPLYISAQDLIKDFQSLLNKSMPQYNQEWFDNKYYEIDLLIIDDIQMLCSAEKTLDTFFNIYNNLKEKNKQIIITSDSMPDELKGLEQRMISRLKNGICVKIESLDTETSIDILKSKVDYYQQTDLSGEHIEMDNNRIPDEVLTYIATNFSKDVRELEGALRTLLFHSIDDSANTYTMEWVQKIFNDTIVSKNDNKITDTDILNTVCGYYNLNKRDLIGKSRMKSLAIPRHIAIYITRTMLETPFDKIGKVYGNRDHSTIMSSYNKIKDLVENEDKNCIDVINEIQELLKS